jgi:hypothetical protein
VGSHSVSWLSDPSRNQSFFNSQRTLFSFDLNVKTVLFRKVYYQQPSRRNSPLVLTEIRPLPKILAARAALRRPIRVKP